MAVFSVVLERHGRVDPGRGMGLPMCVATLPPATRSRLRATQSRVTLGHTGRALTADRRTTLSFVLVGLATLVRLAGAFAAAWSMPLLVASAGFWIAGFGVFVLNNASFLLRPRDAR
jgi:hypothetical protein